MSVRDTSFENYMAAYAVWRKLTKSPCNLNTRRQFDAFISMYEEQTDIFRIRVEWLTGPNAAVMYQIWKAQNGQEN